MTHFVVLTPTIKELSLVKDAKRSFLSAGWVMLGEEAKTYWTGLNGAAMLEVEARG